MNQVLILFAHPVLDDTDEYILTVKANIEELGRLLQVDRIDETVEKDPGWDEESLISEARGTLKETKT